MYVAKIAYCLLVKGGSCYRFVAGSCFWFYKCYQSYCVCYIRYI